MRQLITAIGLSLFLHGLLLSMLMGRVEKESETRILPQFITLELSHNQNKMTTPIQAKKPENIQKISVPSHKIEKKEQIKPDPDRDMPRSVQTRVTNDLFKKTGLPVRSTKAQKAEPEKKIQAQVEPATVRPVKYNSPTDHITHERPTKLPDIHMLSDKADNRLAALSDGKGNVLSPHDQAMQIVMPHYKINPTPPYPEMARQKGYQGIVVLEVLINHDGNVDEMLLLQSSGHIILDRAAKASVKNWVFEPGKKGDETMKMWAKVPIRFQLK